MGTPRLIFCADGNARHAAIAVAEGWEYGARLPARGLAPHPLAFADQDWKRPDRGRYMACLEKHRPALATVLGAAGIGRTPEQLAPQVYLPQRQGSLQVELLGASRRAGAGSGARVSPLT